LRIEFWRSFSYKFKSSAVGKVARVKNEETYIPTLAANCAVSLRFRRLTWFYGFARFRWSTARGRAASRNVFIRSRENVLLCDGFRMTGEFFPQRCDLFSCD